MDHCQVRLNWTTTRKNWPPSSTMEWIPTLTLNGGTVEKILKTLTQLILIQTSGLRLWRMLGSNEQLWLSNTTTVLWFIHLNIQTIRWLQVHGKMVRVTFSKKSLNQRLSMTWIWVFTYHHGMLITLNIMFQLKKSITNTISTNSRKSLAILNTEIRVNLSKCGWMVRVVAELKK